MNKKGTSTVEAAIVFPLVILVVLALISILIFFYQLTESNVKMHLALRAESGRLSGTIHYRNEEDAPFPIYERERRVYSRVSLTFFSRGLLQSLSKDLYAYKYADNEQNFIRRTDLTKGAAYDE